MALRSVEGLADDVPELLDAIAHISSQKNEWHARYQARKAAEETAVQQ
jgi:hypothetical protein